MEVKVMVSVPLSRVVAAEVRVSPTLVFWSGVGVAVKPVTAILAAEKVIEMEVEEVPELFAKLASPLKVAVSVSVPTALGVRAQLPAASEAVQLAPVPSLTVTVSLVGMVPPPGGVTAAE